MVDDEKKKWGQKKKKKKKTARKARSEEAKEAHEHGKALATSVQHAHPINSIYVYAFIEQFFNARQVAPSGDNTQLLPRHTLTRSSYCLVCVLYCAPLLFDCTQTKKGRR